jgi:hypothetical protein
LASGISQLMTMLISLAAAAMLGRRRGHGNKSTHSLKVSPAGCHSLELFSAPREQKKHIEVNYYVSAKDGLDRVKTDV